jgi:predicted Zn-dependent peptidase
MAVSWGAFAGPVKRLDIDGLEVVLETIRDAEATFVGVSFPAGSASEGLQRGGAHLLEHIIQGRVKSRIHDAHTSGGELNAVTTRDYNAYYAYLPNRGVESYLAALSSALDDLRLRGEEVSRERPAVIREIDQRFRGDVAHAAYLRATTSLFPGLTGFDVAGSRRDVRALKVDALQRLFMRIYRQGAVLTIVGPVEHGDIAALLNRANLRLSTQIRKTNTRYSGCHLASAPLSSGIDLHLSITWRVPSIVTAASDQEYWSMELLAWILSRRLAQVQSPSTISYDGAYRSDGLLSLDQRDQVAQRGRGMPEWLNREVSAVELATAADELDAAQVLALDSLYSRGMQLMTLVALGAPLSRLDFSASRASISLADLNSARRSLVDSRCYMAHQ